MRICVALAVMLSTCSVSTASEREQAWDNLIAEARARGAVETKLDRSASYVFRQADGAYVSFTRLLDGDKGRSICLIAKDENATACVDWETGKLTLGSRADAATPWSFRHRESLAAFEAEQPGFFSKLTEVIRSLFAIEHVRRLPHGRYVLSRNGNWYWKSEHLPY